MLFIGTFFLNIPVLATAGQWSANGSVIYYNDGNLGVGTDTPSTKLQIKQSTNGLNLAIRNDADYADLKLLSSYDSLSALSNFMLQTGSGDNFSISTNASNTSSLLINISGSVGIGTNVRQRRFHVAGNGNIFVLEGSTYSYISWYPDSFTSGRKACTGFGNASDDNFTIANEVSGANVVISTNRGALIVPGKVKATEVKVISNVWADYVFDSTYNLRSLTEVKNYINENKHLPGIANAKEIKENGLSLGEMQQKQMEKIEELTLYLIKQDEQIKELKSEINNLLSK